jgi:hypothetical protein
MADLKLGKYKATYVKNVYVEVTKVSFNNVWFTDISEYGKKWIYLRPKFEIDFIYCDVKEAIEKTLPEGEKDAINSSNNPLP